MIVTNVGTGCEDAAVSLTNYTTRTQSRVVLAPDAGVKFGEFIHQATVANKPGHRGEHGISRNTIVQGKPDCAVNLW